MSFARLVGQEIKQRLGGSSSESGAPFEGPSYECRARVLDGGESSGYLRIATEGLSFFPDFTSGQEYHYPASEIIDVALSDENVSSQRFTVTRLLFLQRFALAFPKKQRSVSASLTVSLAEGGHLTLVVDGQSQEQLWRNVSPYTAGYGQEGELVDIELSISAELERLASLHERGVLTDEEFQRAKQQALGNHHPSNLI